MSDVKETPTKPTQPTASGVDARVSSRPSRWRWLLLLVVLLSVLALTLVLVQSKRMTAMQQQLARLSDEATKRSIAAKTTSEQTAAELRQAVGRLSTLEAGVRDLTAYRAQMRDLVQTVVQARDESLLVDLDTSLLLAQDQALLTDSPQPMVVALRAAKRRIAQSSDARLAPVRHAVERDLQRLKEVQVPDTTGLLARIDAVLSRIDDLPVAGDVQAPGGSNGLPQQSAAPDGAEHWWVRWRPWLADRVCGPWCSRNPALTSVQLAPDNVFLIRQNLRLRLLSAKLGVLSRRQDSVRADLAAAVTQLRLAFDAGSGEVAATVGDLQQLRELAYVPVLPRLDDTLTALGQAGALQESD